MAAAVRVPKSFVARHACCLRSYTYHLPAKCLWLKPSPRVPKGAEWTEADYAALADSAAESAAADPPSEAEEEAVLERLRAALARFHGAHPFHNYTRRANYEDASFKMLKEKFGNRPGSAAAGADGAEGAAGADGAASGSDEEEEGHGDDDPEEEVDRRRSPRGAGGGGFAAGAWGGSEGEAEGPQVVRSTRPAAVASPNRFLPLSPAPLPCNCHSPWHPLKSHTTPSWTPKPTLARRASCALEAPTGISNSIRRTSWAMSTGAGARARDAALLLRSCGWDPVRLR